VLVLTESAWTGPRTAVLAAAGGKKIDAVSQLLMNYPDYRVNVESHTDNSGSPDDVQSVTDRRATELASRFAAAGIEESRIYAKGYGASVPVAPNTTVANRAKNRRVYLIFSTTEQ
jgi:outer membrane protein OmpA-like peptidoglycan-associated protein